MFGCFIFDSNVTSFLDDSFSLADIWAENALLIQNLNPLHMWTNTNVNQQG